MVVGIVVLLAMIVQQVVHELGLQDVEWTMDTVRMVANEIHSLFISLYEIILYSRGFDLFSPAVKTTALVLLVMYWFIHQEKPVYLVAFSTFKAPDSWKLSHEQSMQIMRRQNCFTDESLAFLKKILERSGTGQATAWPPGITRCLESENTPSDRSMAASRAESEAVIFDVVEQALRKANVKPREIDFLIINHHKR